MDLSDLSGFKYCAWVALTDSEMYGKLNVKHETFGVHWQRGR